MRGPCQLGRGGRAALYPRPARVRRKAENTLRGPCHKKASGSGIRFLKLFHSHIPFFNPLYPFLLCQPYLPYIISDPLLFISAACFPFFNPLHPFLLCQPYLFIYYIGSSPFYTGRVFSFYISPHPLFHIVSLPSPWAESVSIEQIVSLVKLLICPVCTYFFQIVPIYKLSFSQKINFFDSVYCIILLIKSYSRGERPAQEIRPSGKSF